MNIGEDPDNLFEKKKKTKQNKNSHISMPSQ